VLILTAAQQGRNGAVRMAPSPESVTIKRYAHRRLYDPNAGRYLTLADLAVMVEEDEDFVVHEAKTGADVTRSVLKQIIIERTRHG
jgi:polyhydroxyalkanoate synthesis repressor PhaR